jgi:hypothetical protein
MLTTRITIGLCAVLSTAPVYAQSQNPQYVNIQFKFMAGHKELPPGRYTIFKDHESAPYVTIRSAADNSMVKLQVHTQLARQGEPGADNQKIRLVFDRVGETRYLSEIWLPGRDGLLVHGTSGDHQHDVIVTVVSSLSPDHSGKEIYDATCVTCHGPRGEGDQAADTKFQTSIPRLQSDAVQSKSDEELRDIVTHGRRKMEPVRMGQLTVRHLLDPASVDAVIAYVRTLKQP